MILPQTAIEAKALLEGEVMRGAFEAVERRFISEWMDADTIERREMAHAKVVGLAEVRRQLRTVLQNGEYASLTDER